MMAKLGFRKFRHHAWFFVLGGFLVWLLLIHLISMDAIRVEGGIKFTLSRYDQPKDGSFGYVNSGPNHIAENSIEIVEEGVSGASNSDNIGTPFHDIDQKVVDIQEKNSSPTRVVDAEKVVDAREGNVSDSGNVENEKAEGIEENGMFANRTVGAEKVVNVRENDSPNTKNVQNEKMVDAQEDNLSGTRNIEIDKTVDVQGNNFSEDDKVVDIQENDLSSTRNADLEKKMDVQESNFSNARNVENEKVMDDQDNDLFAIRNVEVEKIVDAQENNFSRSENIENEKTMDVRESDLSATRNVEAEKAMDAPWNNFSSTKSRENEKIVDVQENDLSTTRYAEVEKLVDVQENSSSSSRNVETKGRVSGRKEKFSNADNVKKVDIQKNDSSATRNLDRQINKHPVSEITEDRPSEENQEIANPEKDPCAGRYVYIHTVPRQFHRDLLRDCKILTPWTDMCQVLSNLGLGPQLEPDRTLSKTGWYNTNQFSLEVIFHNRMKQYECLTSDSSIASAFFIPYYAGLDVVRFLWEDARRGWRDAGPSDLVRWLRRRPEWRRMRGKDHFLVAGRIVWDFRRENEDGENWGNNLAILPETKDMTILVLESSLIPNANDFAIPYPTYFHPSKDDDVFQWQEKVRNLRRPFLYTFAGAPRPNMERSIRGEIINQCKASGRRCFFLECHNKANKCLMPAVLMRTFQNAVFCLQPQGDSYTRRSAFDSILAGCIPVFFHSGSFYNQYKWHIPSNHTRYSVFIPENDVKDGKVSIERALLQIPRDRVLAMREEVIKLIPSMIYANPDSELETLEDAFDLTIKGVLERVERFRKERFGS